LLRAGKTVGDDHHGCADWGMGGVGRAKHRDRGGAEAGMGDDQPFSGGVEVKQAVGDGGQGCQRDAEAKQTKKQRRLLSGRSRIDVKVTCQCQNYLTLLRSCRH
jgi:hypothetical protein